MTFHRPIFGRKQTGFGRRPAPPPHAAPAAAEDPPARRILPEELWDGPAGDTLRALGLHPDSPANHAMTQAEADARQLEEIEWQRGFVAKVNAQLPAGTSVVPYAMLPWTLWNGPYGRMLAVTCGLWPTQAWNTMLLAADQRSGFVLDLPEHPGTYPAGLIPELERLLGELRAEMDGAMADAQAAPELTFAAIEAWDAAREAMVPRIVALSHHVGAMCLGEEVFARHKALFGATLGWSQPR